MNIELNKCYRTRDGRKARVICVDAFADKPIAIIVGSGIVTLYPDGRFQGTDSPFDLISEWVDKPEMDRSVLPAWANKAVAMDSDGQWECYDTIPELGESEWELGPGWAHSAIPPSHAPKWSGDWRESLLVFED